MIRATLRFLVGFVLACLVAAAVKVGFVVTPGELLSGDERQWWSAGQLVLLVATQNAVFAGPFAVLAAIISEWQGTRGWAFFVLVGVVIAAAGFAVLYSGESAGQPTIVNSYALGAYLCAGIAGGLVYWLFAGRHAGGGEIEDYYEDSPAGWGEVAGGRASRHRSSVVPERPAIPEAAEPGQPSLPARPASVPISKDNSG